MKTYQIRPSTKKVTRFVELTPANYKYQIDKVAAADKKRMSRWAKNKVERLSESFLEFWKAGIMEGTLDLLPRMNDDYRNFLERIGADPDGPELHVRGQLVDGVEAMPVVEQGVKFNAQIGVKTTAMFTPLNASKNKRRPVPLGMILNVHERGSSDVPARPSFSNAMDQWASTGRVRKLLWGMFK